MPQRNLPNLIDSVIETWYCMLTEENRIETSGQSSSIVEGGWLSARIVHASGLPSKGSAGACANEAVVNALEGRRLFKD